MLSQYNYVPVTALDYSVHVIKKGVKRAMSYIPANQVFGHHGSLSLGRLVCQALGIKGGSGWILGHTVRDYRGNYESTLSTQIDQCSDRACTVSGAVSSGLHDLV